MMRAVKGTHTENRRDELAFRFVAGDRALDLLSTLGSRHTRPVERLREPSDLERWLNEAGLPVTRRPSESDLRDARRLRETLNRLTRATLVGASPADHDLSELNEWACRPSLAPQTDPTFQRHWVARSPVQAALALVAREAVQLLTSTDRRLIRECAASPNCSLLYLDRSPAGHRRWCEMQTCGSRAKMASFRRRQDTHARPR